jgi:hypothetical protein
MSSPKSHSAPRQLTHSDTPYIVRVEVVEIAGAREAILTGERTTEDAVILSKDIDQFESITDAVEFAQKVWKRNAKR